VEDDERRGRPKFHRIGENDEKVRNLEHSDRYLCFTAMAMQLNLDKETVTQILSEDLVMKMFRQIWSHNCRHKARPVKLSLAQKSVTEMKQPPCSHDLAPNDF
jgi:hypothetical protein